MKKIISILSTALFPVISSAHGYGMMDGEYGYNVFGSDDMFSPIFLLIPFLGVILAVACFVFWVLMLVDAIKHTSEKTKLVWVVVIVFTHIIGALIYYFVEKRPRTKIGHKI